MAEKSAESDSHLTQSSLTSPHLSAAVSPCNSLRESHWQERQDHPGDRGQVGRGAGADRGGQRQKDPPWRGRQRGDAQRRHIRQPRGTWTTSPAAAKYQQPYHININNNNNININTPVEAESVCWVIQTCTHMCYCSDIWSHFWRFPWRRMLDEGSISYGLSLFPIMLIFYMYFYWEGKSLKVTPKLLNSREHGIKT